MPKLLLLVFVVLLHAASGLVLAQGDRTAPAEETVQPTVEELSEDLKRVNARLHKLEQNRFNRTEFERTLRDEYASFVMVAWLFAAFCALWAQNVGRNPWWWFFIGLIFTGVAVIFVLILNPRHRTSGPEHRAGAKE